MTKKSRSAPVRIAPARSYSSASYAADVGWVLDELQLSCVESFLLPVHWITAIVDANATICGVSYFTVVHLLSSLARSSERAGFLLRNAVNGEISLGRRCGASNLTAGDHARLDGE